MKEITVEELKTKKENGEDFFLLDVREMTEYLVSNLDGEHIPLGELDARLSEIEDRKDAEVVVMCRSGGRSGKACQYLSAKGFSNVSNLKGGITAWSKQIDPSIPVA
ncbi:MAG: rhodanese-like domain-containing protein [Balneolaceae bacterium]